MCCDMGKKGKIIIISAPSGTGKSTIINRIMCDPSLDLQFSISATSREPRKGEAHGVNYYFFTEADFRKAVAADLFVEWEEVYPGRFYGTLRSEIDRITADGHNVIMDTFFEKWLHNRNRRKKYDLNRIGRFACPKNN